jgi:hypothetical protein
VGRGWGLQRGLLHREIRLPLYHIPTPDVRRSALSTDDALKRRRTSAAAAGFCRLVEGLDVKFLDLGCLDGRIGVRGIGNVRGW